MLKRLRFHNFKSWAQLDMPCAPITGIFGTNSSGKSSILQFLLLLKQTKDATDRAVALELNGNLVQLGTLGDVLHRHEEERALEWSVSWRDSEVLALVDPTVSGPLEVARGQNVSVSAKVALDQKRARTVSLSYKLDGVRFSLKQRTQGSADYVLLADAGPHLSSSFQFTRALGRKWAVPQPIKSYAFPDQVRTYYQNAGFLADLEARYERFVDNIYYLGPLREYPKRDYLWARSRPSGMGLRGENTIDAILAATAAEETRNLKAKAHHMPFQGMIAHWLRELGLIDSFSMREIAEGSNRWQALVRTKPGSSEVFLTDVGFGVSQVLPVITLLQYVPRGSIVLLEQPEIHLHPLAQAELAEVIIQAALHRGIQVIVESHSEHLLLRLQRRIADGSLNPENVKMYFCDAPKGASSLMPLEIDLLGRIENWPSKFMGDAFGETAEAEKARLKRMMKMGAQ